MKRIYIPFAFAIPFLLTLGTHYYETHKEKDYLRMECDCHPSFLLKMSGNQIRCYEDGLVGPALILESSRGDGVYDVQKAGHEGTCSQCHPRDGPVDGETLLEISEAV